MSTDPSAFSRRSSLYHALTREGAVFAEANGGALVTDFGDPEAECLATGQLALADLSSLDRVGFKGAEAPAWLARMGMPMPTATNTLVAERDGVMVAALSRTEALVVEDWSSREGRAAALRNAWSLERDDDCYLVDRAEGQFCFALTGREGPSLFARVCAVDLRARVFPDLAVAQTRIAGMNVVIMRRDTGRVPVYFILGDCSFVRYLWLTLRNAITSLRGRPIGTTALARLGID